MREGKSCALSLKRERKNRAAAAAGREKSLALVLSLFLVLSLADILSLGPEGRGEIFLAESARGRQKLESDQAHWNNALKLSFSTYVFG